MLNVISEAEAGYIKMEKLEARLYLLFGYPIKVQHISNRYYFEAPREVTRTLIADSTSGQNMTSPESDYYKSISPYLRYPVFTSFPGESDIYVFDTTPEANAYSFTNSELFESHIANTPKPDTRIVSICCRNSVRPLGITEQALLKLMGLYDIDPSFFDLALSFGYPPQISDAGHGGMTVKQRNSGAYDMHYLFTYAEDDNKGGAVAWKIRQVCVFQRYDPSESGNLWILLHARPQSKIQRQIEYTLSTTPTALLGSWSSMHLLVLSTYLGGWRWCIRNIGDEIEKTVDIVLYLDPSDPRTGNQEGGRFQLLKKQYLDDRLVPLTARLGTALTTLRQLGRLNSSFHSRGFSSDEEFQSLAGDLMRYINTLEGHLESVKVLERKVRSIADLLAVVLTVENQAVSIGINNKMLGVNNELVKLTSKSLDDNATVRTITLLTLIYLPASFVATFFGMNFFDYGGGEFEMSHRLWIFFAVAIPLTIFTVGSWYWLSRRRKRLEPWAR
ncbi:hypothetical protein BDV59DRAFT_211209 [Aspergillus ambiguus]|uniref:uncharacterized protein n=1 Tax=Aspergillus ambiguus TaxID=176160 RepID=UPI003CCDB521